MMSDKTVDMPAIDSVATFVDTETTQGAFEQTSDGFLNKLNLSRDNLIEIALYFGAGFIVGFLFKRYNYPLILAGLIILGIFGLQYLGLVTVTIHGDKIQSMLGCQIVAPDATLFSALTCWAREHVRAGVSLMSGFVLGVWVG